ncbi:MAG: hypothetical protein Terrestrivirus3_72 [Terrestrivirus sp.]|uniref:Transmembrane protein n=1 Tax=Terrestrivirus sp. TaxID=2487775 RepID=A0A3G4ZQB2_9VIRU|nr:MAG: hypothetical protein Terrestrivirus3_72 [Terrestrivirus sp.]
MSELDAIVNKLKNRIPMFIVIVYSVTITHIINTPNTTNTINTNNYSFDISENPSTNFNKFYFQIYYGLMCLLCIFWDMWHAMRAYHDKKPDSENMFNCILFCIFSQLITLPLFVMITSISTLGLPLVLLFNMSKNNILLFYGVTIPFVYLLNIIERYYWREIYDDFITLEKDDDISTNSNNDHEQSHEQSHD